NLKSILYVEFSSRK
ncbi:hypothetical protein NPIL_558891, partial [Nephila pilipes]